MSDEALRAAIDERLEPGGLCREHVAWMDESGCCEQGTKHFDPDARSPSNEDNDS